MANAKTTTADVVIDALQIAEKQRHLFLLNKVKNSESLSRIQLDELSKLEDKAKAASLKTNRKSSRTIAADIKTENLLLSQKEAARYGKVNARTVRRWEEAGMPTGTVNGKKCYFKNQIDIFKSQAGIPSEAKSRQAEAEADGKEIRAKLLEIKLKIQQGELVDLDTVEGRNVRKVVAIKRALIGIGRTLAPGLAKEKNPKRIQQIIDKQIRFIIERFAKNDNVKN